MIENALKAISENENELRVGNYIVLWGDEKHRDLEGIGTPRKNKDGSRGEYFTKATAFDSEYTKANNVLLDWEHRRDKAGPGDEVLGYVDWSTAKADDKGLWVERVLDRAKTYVQYIKRLIDAGIVGSSSEALPDQVKVKANGEIERWPIRRDTLTVTPMEPRMITENVLSALKALELEELINGETPEPKAEAEGEQQSAEAAKGAADIEPTNNHKEIEMEELDTKIADAVAKALKEQELAAEKARQEADERQKAIDEAVKAEREKMAAEFAKSNRLPEYGGKAPAEINGEIRKFDNLSASETALMIDILRSDPRAAKPSEGAYKALAMKLESKDYEGTEEGHAFKALGMKSDELNYSTLASYGDEWVGIAYSREMWDKIRADNPIVNRVPGMEVPQGVESVKIPLASTDPTWYKVAEAADLNATTGRPDATITASRTGTAQQSLTLGKMGARQVWSGEMEERSLIPFMSQLQAQLVASGQEQLEHVILDGDVTTTGSTNINDIGNSSTQTATNLHLLFNGFRKLPLVTNTANSRSAAGGFDITDFIETVKLMGSAGINAFDQGKVSFIVDPNTHWAALDLPEVKTRDVFSRATIENGFLKNIYGYEVIVAANMHYKSTARLANSAGKVDQTTTTNNAYGAILAVRWDQWKFGYQRRLKIETSRYPEADANQIVATMVCGMVYRDTEAAAITYYVGV